MNGYFQLQVEPTGVYIMIYPPTEGGEPVKYKEVTEYLGFRRLEQYNAKELNDAIKNQTQAVEVEVAPPMELSVNEVMDIRVSSDKMQVFCRFYPPSNGGQMMYAPEIVNDLAYNHIRYGIDQDEISKFLSEREYCRDYVFAKGTEPVHGTDATIKYYFNVDVNLKPKKNEDGTVDYRDLNTISRVNAGDLLAKLIPEDNGTPGRDVYGTEIKPRSVKKGTLEYGNNIRISEDRTELYTEVTGHASLVNHKVFVSDVYEVPADVDNSIGNIEYSGNVHIGGNVKGGFSVKAQGDIIVEGVVEDAELEAGGQIIVKRGIHGKNKGSLSAEGNVICQFIENATVTSGGFVETDSILHSQVSAYSEIHANGDKGFITGGVIRAGSLVEAQTIGSEMGAATHVEVGTDPKQKERMSELKVTIAEESSELEKIKLILATYTRKLQSGEKLPPQKMEYIQKLAYSYKAKKGTLEPLQEEYEKLQKGLTMANHAKVQIRNSIYPGVTLAISELELVIKDKQTFCQFMKKDGEIARSTL